MQSKFEQLKTEALLAIKSVSNKIQLEDLENKLLGRKSGQLTTLMKGLKDLTDDARKVIGVVANEVKKDIEAAFENKKNELMNLDWGKAVEKERVDITQPSLPKIEKGTFHPNTIIQKDLEDFFTSMGFMVLEGPEIESDYFNFTSLNIPLDHPARDMQDTLYLKNHSDWLMRTHTSSADVRFKQKYGAPMRVVHSGKCFRNEATDVRHEHTFYQFQGIVIDEGINFSHLKGTLEALVKHLYGPDTKLRLRPKYYPFVEPGVNGEVTCFFCKGQGCRVCKNTGWLEILGAGLIHPNVLREGEIDTKKYSGFAFGFGLTRLVMLKYGIEDVRLLESGDLKFLKQF